MDDVRSKPHFTSADAAAIASEHFKILGEVTELPGERDQNFKVSGEDGTFVIKVAHPNTTQAQLELENAAIQIAGSLRHIHSPSLIRSEMAALIEPIRGSDGQTCFTRCLTFLPGTPVAELTPSSSVIEKIGMGLGELDLALANLNRIPSAKRELQWDLKNAAQIVSAGEFENENQASILRHFLGLFDSIKERFHGLRESLIHNDANDYNLLIEIAEAGDTSIGLIDFGDLIYSKLINELAICAAYLILENEQPVDTICSLVSGYHSQHPLTESELSVLFPMTAMRLCQSVVIAKQQRKLQPDNEYLSITERPAWATLEKLIDLDPSEVHMRISKICAQTPIQTRNEVESNDESLNSETIQQLRNKHLSPSLSLSYDQPIHIVRGSGQYLYDSSDITYLDCVNNVCHVGHCHPEVVAAATSQIRTLNTNTRYLHENIVRYAKRLTETLPPKLEVCFFVNSGSEANDLAIRLIRAYTNKTGLVVMDHAYHGHTQALIQISPYKFNGRGGQGQPKHVAVLPMPDGVRGPYRYDEPNFSQRYVDLAIQAIVNLENLECGIGGFFAEAILSCGGQVTLPFGYLRDIYREIRSRGGICVADEVQVGFGRVGKSFWGFELHDVTPDIVTMGKPIGNGHPMAAVVTTRAIAESFDNGMEYFNTYGGNPVSSAVGISVLDVIAKEKLKDHAARVGKILLDGFHRLQMDHECIGDVRGEGL
ncbi:MAG: aminotransferase class III-fold pyridoxal phosphate-dependent enzyme, partial [Planctomycetota bacterium]